MWYGSDLMVIVGIKVFGSGLGLGLVLVGLELELISSILVYWRPVVSTRF